MPDTPNTTLRRIIEKHDRKERFWRRVERAIQVILFLTW